MPKLDLRQRYHLAINAGNVLEFFGAAMGTTAMYLYVGLPAALGLGAVLLILGAEFSLADHVWRVPLLLRPHPVNRFKSWRFYRKYHVRVKA
jgi:hypothetical protein